MPKGVYVRTPETLAKLRAVGAKRRVNVGSCEVAGCSGKAESRQMCRAHYNRWYKGQPLEGEFRVDAYGAELCAYEDCTRLAKGGAKGLCPMHYSRLWRNGDPSVVKDIVVGSGEESVHWKGDEISSYSAAHERVRAVRKDPGQCEHCGGDGSESRLEWALDHEHAAAIKWGNNQGSECAFSPDPYDYLRLCSQCHRDFDRNA